MNRGSSEETGGGVTPERVWRGRGTWQEMMEVRTEGMEKRERLPINLSRLCLLSIYFKPGTVLGAERKPVRLDH